MKRKKRFCIDGRKTLGKKETMQKVADDYGAGRITGKGNYCKMVLLESYGERRQTMKKCDYEKVTMTSEGFVHLVYQIQGQTCIDLRTHFITKGVVFSK